MMYTARFKTGKLSLQLTEDEARKGGNGHKDENGDRGCYEETKELETVPHIRAQLAAMRERDIESELGALEYPAEMVRGDEENPSRLIWEASLEICQREGWLLAD